MSLCRVASHSYRRSYRYLLTRVKPEANDKNRQLNHLKSRRTGARTAIFVTLFTIFILGKYKIGGRQGRTRAVLKNLIVKC